ncbi:13129_t:CDS:2, partial [Acaulospora morrowiae]
ERTTASRCYVQINQQPVITILDTGAVVSLISKNLLDKLNLRINEKSNTIVVTATGVRERMLGKVKNIEVLDQKVGIPIDLQVVKSRDEMLLLGTDWFQKSKARIHFDEKKLYLQYAGEAIEVPISHHGTESLLEPESDQESAETDLFDEFEYEEEKVDERGGYYTGDVLSDEELYENPWEEMESLAIYLTNVEEVPTLEGEKEPELTTKERIESLIEKNTELGEEDKETQSKMVQVITPPLGDSMNVQGRMHSMYRHLRWLQRTQQCIQSLVYAYYLGMLLTQ